MNINIDPHILNTSKNNTPPLKRNASLHSLLERDGDSNRRQEEIFFAVLNNLPSTSVIEKRITWTRLTLHFQNSLNSTTASGKLTSENSQACRTSFMQIQPRFRASAFNSIFTATARQDGRSVDATFPFSLQINAISLEVLLKRGFRNIIPVFLNNYFSDAIAARR